MGFFANEFSRSIGGLLTLIFISCNTLIASNLGENMPKTRSEIPEQDCWNVSALYLDPTDWKKDLQKTQSQESQPHWPELKTYQGKLKDPSMAAAFFERYFEIDRKLSKLYTYAHLRMDEDLGNDDFKSNYGVVRALLNDFQVEGSWIEPELLSLSETDFKKILGSKELKPYQFYLEQVGRMRPHTLTPEMEELMAMSGKALEASSKAFGALSNADLHFKPAVDSEGKEHLLSNGSFLGYMRSPDRNLRKSAYENLHLGYEEHANTLCELIQGQVQKHLFSAKARKYSGCLEAALYPHAVDRAVYENLIATVRKHLPLMHQYVAMRKKEMGLDQIHMYDLYIPLVKEVRLEMNYTDACKAVVASVEPLGKDYQAVLKKGLSEERWVDVFENTRKRSGAYSSGCYDSMPYILMNYHGHFGDVQTLAHEAGHSMHSFLSRKNQPYIYSGYSIFVAEVASTFNEQLLVNHMKKQAKTKEEMAYLVNDEIERIRGTIFRQTMFAEFELQVHKWAEEGVPLTPALLKKYYLELNRAYYGPEMVLDSGVDIEWARIPHFYYNFYVYQYATGLSAAMALYQKAMTSPEARDKYLQFLSSGGSKYPLDLLEQAGVNMRKPEAVEAALQKFGALVEELKRTL